MTKALILIATDLSPSADLAVEKGAKLAAAFGAKVVLFHSYDPMPAVPPGAIPDPAGFEAAIEREIVASIDEAMERARNQHLRGLDPSDVELCVERSSTPAKAVCDAAKKRNAAFVVVSTHGLTGLKHMLIGSVAERIVRHAPCSVLVAR